MLELLFRSKVITKLIAYFVNHSGKEVYLREISREISEPANAVLRDLEKLEEFGLLRSRRHGNHKYFSVRENLPVLPELKSLVLKTDGAVDFLKDQLSSLSGVQLAFAFGSFAEKPTLEAAEIGLVIVGLSNGDGLNRLVADIQAKLGRRVYYAYYTPDEFKSLLKTKDPALNKALSGKKIVLVANVENYR